MKKIISLSLVLVMLLSLTVINVNAVTDEITLNVTSLTLKKGETFKLVPSKKLDGLATLDGWKSSNDNIADVDDDGTVEAVGPGTATIWYGEVGYYDFKFEKYASCKVTVNRVKTSKITLNIKKVILEKGKTKKLKATVSPKNTDDKVKWKSSNKKIATVTSKGKVKAKNLGIAKITATAGKKKATCKVTVNTIYINRWENSTIKLKSYVKNIKGYKKGKWVKTNNKKGSLNSKGIAKVKQNPNKPFIAKYKVNGKTYKIKIYSYSKKALKQQATLAFIHWTGRTRDYITGYTFYYDEGKCNVGIEFIFAGTSCFFAWYDKGGFNYLRYHYSY